MKLGGPRLDMKSIIITDSCCDLPYDYIKKNNLIVIPFPYSIDGKDYIDDFGKSLSYKDFYDKLRNGSIHKLLFICFSRCLKNMQQKGM